MYNNNLFVSLIHFKDNSKNGLPVFINRIYTEKINESKPMQPIYTNEWLFYNLKKDGIPVPEKFILPKHIFMICKGLKEINFDFYTQERGEWIVSEKFYNFIKSNHLFENLYDICKLTIQTTTGKKLGTKEYFLMRFIKDNDDLVDWENSPNTVSNRNTGIKFSFYEELVFYENKNIPAAMFFTKIAFKHSFVIKENIKEIIEKENFLGYDLYTLKDFIIESQKRIDYFQIKK